MVDVAIAEIRCRSVVAFAITEARGGCCYNYCLLCLLKHLDTISFGAFGAEIQGQPARTLRGAAKLGSR